MTDHNGAACDGPGRAGAVATATALRPELRARMDAYNGARIVNIFKFALRALVGGIVVNTIDEMDLHPPQLDANDTDDLARAKYDRLAA